MTGIRAHGRLPGCIRRSTAAVLLVGVAFFAVSAGTASAGTWYLTVSPARVLRGGNVAIKTTTHARCQLILRIKGTPYRYTMSRLKLLTIPRDEPTGRVRVEVDCGNTYATNSFSIVAAALAHRTPITVANVCHLDQAFGTRHLQTINGVPTIYWTNASNVVTMFVSSSNGNEVAAVLNAQGGIAYFAYCSWSKWLTIAQYEQAVAQQGVSNSQASSLGYLLQEQTNNSIYEEEADWFTPSPGWQECPTNPYDQCDYEYTGGG